MNWYFPFEDGAVPGHHRKLLSVFLETSAAVRNYGTMRQTVHRFCKRVSSSFCIPKGNPDPCALQTHTHTHTERWLVNELERRVARFVHSSGKSSHRHCSGKAR